ncbi:hypothetical protein FF2_010432 [Malus domestica]
MQTDLSRIALRPFRLSDADDVLSFGGDDQVTRVLRGFKTLTTEDEALNFIKNVCIPHPWRRSICIDDRSIGFVTMFPGSGDDRHKADMGYALAARYWGQGITAKAVRIALSQVFKDYPDLVRLQSFVAVENKVSQRVLEKVGFQREGVLRKYLYLKGDIKDMTSMLDSHSPFHDDFVAKMILNKIISGHSGYPMPMISCHTPAMISSDAIPPMEDVDNQKTKP